MKLEKILSRIAVIVTIGLLIFSIFGGFAVYDYFFPLADVIVCPKAEDVTSISFAQNNSPDIVIETSSPWDFLQCISNTEPTRKWSIQDFPAAENYYIVELDTPERKYRYFVYVENSQVYLESPYEGIYKANQQILDLVAEHFED